MSTAKWTNVSDGEDSNKLKQCRFHVTCEHLFVIISIISCYFIIFYDNDIAGTHIAAVRTSDFDGEVDNCVGWRRQKQT